MNAMNSIHIYLLLLTLRFSSSIFLKPESKKYIYIYWQWQIDKLYQGMSGVGPGVAGMWGKNDKI